MQTPRMPIFIFDEATGRVVRTPMAVGMSNYMSIVKARKNFLSSIRSYAESKRYSNFFCDHGRYLALWDETPINPETYRSLYNNLLLDPERFTEAAWPMAESERAGSGEEKSPE